MLLLYQCRTTFFIITHEFPLPTNNINTSPTPIICHAILNPSTENITTQFQKNNTLYRISMAIPCGDGAISLTKGLVNKKKQVTT